ncbi:hypothetical protein [Alkaliphilus hydrothermalis]|uniref:Uncharacterized protein n=1 Tax=Alkaliphilus hydrothermalis TaxID=1482730 RepID=A0ABS2NM16_9FIRM|nr:hypothetical protein [Alkaliphilus hydrothermalis]MBM7613968.1 hypothetical protein [Alkaliphilus hydrothermalis]
MVDFLLNYSLVNKTPITIMYQKGMEITQRNIRVIKITENLIQGYCYTRKTTRNFTKDNILAAMNTHLASSALADEVRKLNC